MIRLLRWQIGQSAAHAHYLARGLRPTSQIDCGGAGEIDPPIAVVDPSLERVIIPELTG
ncbi:MAG: hypothetical protein U1E76_03130 [Planctomycetota bacterium]